MWHSWFRRLFKRAARQPARRTVPRLESLEDRLTPSTVSFDNGVLTYQAGAGVASNLFYIEVTEQTGKIIDTFFNFTDDQHIDTGNLPLGSANQGGIPDSVSVALNNVPQVVIHLGNGNSHVEVAGTDVTDSGDQQFHIYRVGAHFSRSLLSSSYETFARDGHTIATLTGTTEVTIEGSAAGDVFGVDGCIGPIHVFGNGGNNLVVVGTNRGLDAIDGLVTFDDSSPANNHLTINDSNASAGHTYDLHSAVIDDGGGSPIPSTALDRDGTTLVACANVQILSIETSSLSDQFNATMAAGEPAIDLSMNAGNDTLTAKNLGSDFFITGHNAGKLVALGATLQFDGVENLAGGNGSDTFHFTNAGLLDGSIDGGLTRSVYAVKTLDYSACTKNIFVNLKLQTATGVKGTVTNIENVTGGSASDLLVGDGNANLLIGGNGNNVIMGGGGGDTIHGGAGSDLLIAGSTVYDSNSAALAAIFKEWAKSTQTYSQRIAALRAGVSYAVPSVGLHKQPGRALATLNAQTVLGDAPACQLKGNGGLDWFWATSPTEVLDLESGEVIN